MKNYYSMKKFILLVIFLASSSLVLGNTLDNRDYEHQEKCLILKEENKVPEPERVNKKVECSTEVNGITYTATGRARTIEQATDRCVEELARIVAHVQGVPLPEKVD